MSESKSSTEIEYRPIPDFPGYRVGNDGSVWSSWKLSRDTQGRIVSMKSSDWTRIAPWLTQGYPTVSLRRNRQTKRRAVHVLVALVFLGPCPNGSEVCHEDGSRDNNTPANLRYDTRKNNLADRERHGTSQRGERNPSARLTNAQAEEMKKRRIAGERLKTLAAAFGVRESTVSRIANGVRRA
jgi:hypothetical protein